MFSLKLNVSLVSFICLNCVPFNEGKLIWLFVSEPSCAVCHFDCIFFPSSLGFFMLWHAKTSILESVKLLKCESVHGRGLEFVAISVCFTSFCWYVSNCIFTHSCILSSVCYCYCFTILKQCQWRSAVVTCYIVSACPLLFTWTWS